MRASLTIAIMVTFAAVVAGLSTPAAAEQDGQSQVYEFPSDHPGHMTTVVVIRNENKLRPVFITGRGAGGQLEFDPENPARAEGSFSIAAGRYSTSRADAERMAATEWVEADSRPTIKLEVDALNDWEKTNDNRFSVRLTGRIRVNDQSTRVAGAANIRTHGEGRVQGHPAPDRLALTATFTVEGSELGLSGDDAGEIQFRFVGFGFVR